MFRRCCTFFQRKPLAELRQERAPIVARLSEIVHTERLLQELENPHLVEHYLPKVHSLKDAMNHHPTFITQAKARHAVEAAMMTYVLHIESRVTALLEQAFYTIGPCGEESLAPLGMVLRPEDPVALHYRHLAVNISRQLNVGVDETAIFEARARGYVVATTDPATGGHHCALSGLPNDFLVTSTLASQTCPAVGRALGTTLAHSLNVKCPFPKDAVSFVSLGDGSVSNGHFLSGANLAEFAAHRKFKVPVVFCITDNGISISLKNKGFVKDRFLHKLQMPVFRARGCDMVDTWIASERAIRTAREKMSPVTLYLHDITRRFGHAATDRQHAYLTEQELRSWAETNNLLPLFAQAIDAGLYTQEELGTRFTELWTKCKQAFEVAHQEPKITTREEVEKHNSAELVPAAQLKSIVQPQINKGVFGITGKDAQVMRKHMNKIFSDLMHDTKDVVYLGEDVTHGGYYLVTEGLFKKFPKRISDFPPDETSLVGTGMGYSHAGLVPIVEIPYAKYLDCGMDMFAEACIMNWLSKSKQPNGMIFRLQGFGRGIFGGNFHTHNILHMPPGLDVICCSNGPDYQRHMRYAIEQARNGRVIMFVDCTELLNMRHLPGAESLSWEFDYSDKSESRDFDAITVYRGGDEKSNHTASCAVVAYGTSFISALQAQKILKAERGVDIDVIDCPLLSDIPQGLRDHLKAARYEKVLFADTCKWGQHPFATHYCGLIRDGVIDGSKSRVVASPRTYNPLGNKLTFLSEKDILDQLQRF